jgi:hypothetical protein
MNSTSTGPIQVTTGSSNQHVGQLAVEWHLRHLWDE